MMLLALLTAVLLAAQSSPAGSHSSHAEFECLDSASLLASALEVPAPEGSSDLQTFVVPPLPLNSTAYAYATEQAFVVLPQRCVAELGLEPNVGDLGHDVEQWLGRMGDLPRISGRETILSSCACGWVLFAHGSGGFTYDNVRYTLAMAAAGYGIIAPDSFASKELGLRYKAPIHDLPAYLRKLNQPGQSGSYWCDNNVYQSTSTCSPAMKKQATASSFPLCYDSNANAILSDTSAWRQFYERVFHLRRMELDHVVDNLPSWIENSPKLFLAGESEGGMVASRYSHPKLDVLLKSGGRVVLQWGCEWCYFVSCPSNADVGGRHTDLTIPLLNVISHVDNFFGPTGSGSVADRVASAAAGYGRKGLTGNCFAQLQERGFVNAYVINDINSPYHGLTETSGNLLRSLLVAFLAQPKSSSLLDAFGPQGAKVCTIVHQEGNLHLADCSELGDEECLPGSYMPECAYSEYRYHTQYHLLGSFEQCALAPPRILYA